MHDEPTTDEGGSGHTILVPRTRTISRSDSRSHYLVVEEGPEVGLRVCIDKGIRIGRVPPAELVLTGPGVSRIHCKVENRYGEIVVTDLGSTNGTFVDGRETAGSTILRIGGMLQVGENFLHHEYRERREVEQSKEMDRDLQEARQYVQSLLPAPWRTGPVTTEWMVMPSATLGGDALGYQELEDRKYALYLVDVSGHGSGPAMHTVSVMNVLRYRTLPQVDFSRPEQVIKGLNSMFKMDQHGDMYFTIWYGVYDSVNRSIEFCSGGHHPAFLVPADRSASIPLNTRNVAVGAVPSFNFKVDRADVPPGSSLYLFSDGVFEITTAAGTQWDLEDFVPLLTQPLMADLTEPQRLRKAVRIVQQRDEFDDDFSMLVARFD